ncbi:MAG: DEAD/DEAH box helicase [Flavobacteriales bacterium]|nr:DEAD/DEAH box helicase [Flavobacteriales bacterium]
MNSFKDLGLSESLLKAVDKKGYTEPTQIQSDAIPVILQKKDIMASAQTGTGKTAGFTLPILQLLMDRHSSKKRKIRALILTPTRELAAQIQENIKEYGKFTSLRSAVIFGGVNQKPQVKVLSHGVDILVATPGRLLDLENQGEINLSNIDHFVLDEADRMLDMGFARDIQRILHLLPKRRQNMLFSATFSKEIKKLAHKLLHNPEVVHASPANTTAELVIQKAIKVDKGMKTALLTKLISNGDWSQVLVFTRTKHMANRVSGKLEKKNITSAAIHGNKSQGARTRALANFKEGKCRVLVATDIAARGLDIPLLPHVVNFELPNVPEDYVHRIGRTGRAGADGEAISLVCAAEMEYLKNIEKLLGETITLETIEGFTPTEDFDAPPPPKPNSKRRYNSRSKQNNRTRNRSRSGNKRRA